MAKHKDAATVTEELKKTFVEILWREYTDGITGGAFRKAQDAERRELAAAVAKQFEGMPMTDAQMDAVVGSFKNKMQARGQKAFSATDTYDAFATQVDADARKKPELDPVQVEEAALKAHLQASANHEFDDRALTQMVKDIRAADAASGNITADAVAKKVTALQSFDAGKAAPSVAEITQRELFQNKISAEILKETSEHMPALDKPQDPVAYGKALESINKIAGQVRNAVKVDNPEIHVAAVKGAQYAEATKGKPVNPQDIAKQMSSMKLTEQYAFLKGAHAVAAEGHKQHLQDAMDTLAATDSTVVAKVKAAEKNLAAAKAQYKQINGITKQKVQEHPVLLEQAQKVWKGAHDDAMKPFAAQKAVQQQAAAAAAKQKVDAQARADRMAKATVISALHEHAEAFKAAEAEIAAINTRAVQHGKLDAAALADPANSALVAAVAKDNAVVGSYANAMEAQKAARDAAAQQYAKDFVNNPNVTLQEHTDFLKTFPKEFQNAALAAINIEIASAPTTTVAEQERKAAMEAWHTSMAQTMVKDGLQDKIAAFKAADGLTGASQAAARDAAVQEYARDFVANPNVTLQDHDAMLHAAPPAFQKAALAEIQKAIASVASTDPRKVEMEAWHQERSAAVAQNVAFNPTARDKEAKKKMAVAEAVAVAEEARAAAFGLSGKEAKHDYVLKNMKRFVSEARQNDQNLEKILSSVDQNNTRQLFDAILAHGTPSSYAQSLKTMIAEADLEVAEAETRNAAAKTRMAELMKNVDPRNPDFSAHDAALAAMNQGQRMQYLAALAEHTQPAPGASVADLKATQTFRATLADRRVAAHYNLENDPAKRTQAEQEVVVAAKVEEKARQAYFNARSDFETKLKKGGKQIPVDNGDRNKLFQQSDLGKEMYAQWFERDAKVKETLKVLQTERAASRTASTSATVIPTSKQTQALKAAQGKVSAVKAAKADTEAQKMAATLKLAKEKRERAEEFKKLVAEYDKGHEETGRLTRMRRSIAADKVAGERVWVVGPLENQLRDATSKKSEGLADLDAASAKVGRVIQAASEDFAETKEKHTAITSDLQYLEEDARKNMRARVTQEVLKGKKPPLSAQAVKTMAEKDPKAFADLKKEVEAKVKEAEKAHKAKIDKIKDQSLFGGTFEIMQSSYEKMVTADKQLQVAGDRLKELDRQQKDKSAELQSVGAEINRLKEELAQKADDRKWWQRKDQETKEMEQQLKEAREARKQIGIEMRKVVREVDQKMKDYTKAKAKYEENYPKVEQQMKAAMAGPDVVAKDKSGVRPVLARTTEVAAFDEKAATVTKAVDAQALAGQKLIEQRREAERMKKMAKALTSQTSASTGAGEVRGAKQKTTSRER